MQPLIDCLTIVTAGFIVVLGCAWQSARHRDDLARERAAQWARLHHARATAPRPWEIQ